MDIKQLDKLKNEEAARRLLSGHCNQIVLKEYRHCFNKGAKPYAIDDNYKLPSFASLCKVHAREKTRWGFGSIIFLEELSLQDIFYIKSKFNI